MALLETKTDTDYLSNDNNGESISFRAELSNLKGINPINIEFDQNTLTKNMNEKMHEIFKLTTNALKFKNTYNIQQIPVSFPIKISTINNIDFENNEFSIDSNTRFIEYWNDFLDKIKLFDDEKKNPSTQIEGEIRYDGQLEVQLKNNNLLRIGAARIQFQRTLRIPDDNKVYPLPPSLGQFEIVRVQNYMNSAGIPNNWKKRKGCIIPMWQKEAMWINFSCNKPCAVKVGVGKINAVTGKEWKSRNLTMNIDEQNYCAIPKQLWLDGVNCGDGYIRQFVAMPLGKGYTIEHQVKKMVNEKEKQKDKIESDKGDNSNNEVMIPDDIYDADEDEKKEEIFEDVGGIQFEVFPRFDENVHLSVNKNH
eukprot:140276_1